MTTKTEPKPDLGNVDTHWPPVAHIARKPVEKQTHGLCGAKLMGIVLDDAEKICSKCLEIMERERAGR